MAKVVNVKVKYIRDLHGYANLKEWCEDEKNVYIGRKGIVFVEVDGKKERYPKRDSIWCNPYKVNKDLPLESSLELFTIYIKKKILNGEITLSDFEKLRGKNLGCWCKPNRCHGDVILDMLDTIEKFGWDAFIEILENQ